jgi:caffeoyl-CoA O-methyltransferase
MDRKLKFNILLLCVFAFFSFSVNAYESPTEAETIQNLDEGVRNFLDSHKYSWRDMNVPEADGQVLYDLIIENKYKKALEIGTSTGHSAIWIAWALSKTGGKLITIEIDEERYREAVANFQEAGLSGYIDARLADAHQLVNELDGPFDFVFIDADKGWYTNYAKALISKMEAGGCMTAHNVYQYRSGGRGGFRRGGMGGGDYYEFMASQPDFETFIHPEGRGGLAVSYKKKVKKIF